MGHTRRTSERFCRRCLTCRRPPCGYDWTKARSPARAKEIYDAQEVGGRGVVFVDARNWTEFSAGHIRGAMWIDKKHFDGATPRKIREFLPGNAVVVYCHGELCTDSEAVVRRLHALNLGIGPFFILRDGFDAWKRAGYPVDSGSEVGFDVR
ncbi:rhodanese-like domain-containing protein [Leptolyngbya sp. 15MV]|nr:rhodanese-like domain-containing protein [Leptolyngbya sp. 15MV]